MDPVDGTRSSRSGAPWGGRVALALLGVLLAAGPAPGLEVEYRPMEPDPINSPMPRPMAPTVSLPSPRVLPVVEVPGAPAAPAPPREGPRGVFTVVRRNLGSLAVRDGPSLRVFRLSPLGPQVPEDLKPGDRVEISWGEGDVLKSLQVR